MESLPRTAIERSLKTSDRISVQTAYLAIIHDDGHRMTFATLQEATAFLKRTSAARNHSKAEAHHFFLHESSVLKMETLHGWSDCFNIGWLAREEAGRTSEPENNL